MLMVDSILTMLKDLTLYHDSKSVLAGKLEID